MLPLGLSAGMSAGYATIQNKIYGSRTTALVFSNEETEDIMRIEVTATGLEPRTT